MNKNCPQCGAIVPDAGRQLCPKCGLDMQVIQAATIVDSQDDGMKLSDASVDAGRQENTQATIIEPVAPTRVNDMGWHAQNTLVGEGTPQTMIDTLAQEARTPAMTAGGAPSPSVGPTRPRNLSAVDADMPSTKVGQSQHTPAARAPSDDAEVTTLDVGSVVNQKYRIVGVLGKGGLGVVYKVEHLLLPSKKFFALKVLHSHLSQNAQFRKRFIREVEVAMEFAHEHAVQIRDFGETTDGCQYFTMDFCQGQPLRQLMNQSGAMSAVRALNLARQVLSALQNAHAKGIVHRDLKPENIMVEDRFGKEHALVLDFGIAKIVSDDPDNKMTGASVIGTPLYMSPEQASGEEIDTRTDIYAMGVILYEMITGKPPFQGTTRQILVGHILQAPTLPSGINHNIAPDVENVITKAMAKKREDRFATAEEFIAAIDTVTAGGALPGTVRRSPTGKHGKLPWLAASIGLLALLGVGAWWQQNSALANLEWQFTSLLQQQKFAEAQAVAEQVERMWLHRNKAPAWQQRLADAQKEHLAQLVKQMKQSLERAEIAEALKLLESGEQVQKGFAEREAMAIHLLAQGQQSMKNEQWENAHKSLLTARQHCTQELPELSLPFVTRWLDQCQGELGWAQAMQQGKVRLEQGDVAGAMQAFASAEKWKKESAAKELRAVEQILAGLGYYDKGEWEKAVSELTAAQEYCQKMLPELAVPVLAQTLQKCRQELHRQQQEYNELRARVNKQIAALKKSWQEKDWPAIGPQLEALAQEKTTDEEKALLASWQSQYPPVTMDVFHKNAKLDPWQKASGVLMSNSLYQLRMQFHHQLYAYGFQQESSGKIQPIFPKNEKGLYSFNNPIKPGEYYIPSPGAAFRLDRQLGYEHFYLLYSNLPLKDPGRVLDDHLTSTRKYPLILILTFEHK